MVDIPQKVRELADTAAALAELVQIADRFNQLKQYEAEHAQRIAKLKADQEAAVEELAATVKRIDERNAEADAIRLRANEDAAGIVKAARVEAEKIGAQSDELVQAAQEQVAAHKADLAAVLSDITGAKRALSDLADQIAEANAIIARGEAIRKALGA